VGGGALIMASAMWSTQHVTATLAASLRFSLEYVIAQLIPILNVRTMLWNKVAHFNMLRQIRDRKLGCIIRDSYHADVAVIISP